MYSFISCVWGNYSLSLVHGAAIRIVLSRGAEALTLNQDLLQGSDVYREVIK